MRGRKPLPTATKEASGAYTKDPQRRNQSEPTATVGFPDVPPSVASDSVARECWDRTTKTLDDMGILTVADYAILEAYCSSYSQWKWLSEVVREGNCATITGSGSLVSSPESQQVHKYADRMIKLLVELGLTPSARSRLHVAKKEDADPFVEFLNRRMSEN